jgi:hypothetical protein
MQGARPGDVCEAEENEIVMPVICDSQGSTCSCDRLMIGVRTSKETTTALIVESDMSRDEYRRAIRESEMCRELAELKMSDAIFDAQADELLELAAKFAPGTIIERKGDDFEERPASAGAHVV